MRNKANEWQAWLVGAVLERRRGSGGHGRQGVVLCLNYKWEQTHGLTIKVFFFVSKSFKENKKNGLLKHSTQSISMWYRHILIPAFYIIREWFLIILHGWLSLGLSGWHLPTAVFKERHGVSIDGGPALCHGHCSTFNFLLLQFCSIANVIWEPCGLGHSPSWKLKLQSCRLVLIFLY